MLSRHALPAILRDLLQEAGRFARIFYLSCENALLRLLLTREGLVSMVVGP